MKTDNALLNVITDNKEEVAELCGEIIERIRERPRREAAIVGALLSVTATHIALMEPDDGLDVTIALMQEAEETFNELLIGALALKLSRPDSDNRQFPTA